MMSTATKLSSASVKAGSGPKTSQTRKVTVASAITTGTKMPLILSASRCIGAFEPCASSTICMIWARAVSLPTFVAVKRNVPVLFIVAPMTSSSSRLVTGMGSPEIMASSTADSPETTRPSTGTFSPGRTTTTSPTSTSSTGMSASSSPRTTRAVLAWSPASFFMASLVRPFARASSSRPSRISVTIRDEVSKYTSARPAKSPGASVATALYRYAALVPTATSVFMFACPCLSAPHAP